MKKRIFAIIASAAFVLAAALSGGCSDVKKLPEKETLSALLENYELVFEDDFDGDEIDTTKWRVGYNTPARRAAYYEQESAFVENGNLVIRTSYKDGKYGEGWYTSWLETATDPNEGQYNVAEDGYKGFSQTYGYFEVRCKVPECIGIWSAFWLMPDGAKGMTADDVLGTGEDGIEIDVMESPWLYWEEPELNVHVLHGDGYNATKTEKSPSYKIPGMYDTFHTYGVMWTDKEYIFFVDGRETWRSSHVVDGKTLGVSKVNQYMLLTVEVAGYEDDNGVLHPGVNKDGSPYWCGNPDENDKSATYDFVVDYVRAYKLK